MIRELIDEVEKLRQIIWDIYGILGYDQDGYEKAPQPGTMNPDVPELVLAAVKEYRKEHDQLE